MKVKKGDSVLIVSGKDRGRKGKVLKSLPGEEKILVEGINLKKKHIRPKKTGEKGQIVEIPVPIHISNLKIICPKCGKTTRTAYRREEKKRTRICKKCGQNF